jgi:hypothetical protein
VERYDWARLTTLQVGKYAEYYAKMEFTLWGFDVFSAEVDEHGIDFVVRKHPGPTYDIQVKSARDFNYVFIHKHKFQPRTELLAALVLYRQMEPPSLYLIPSIAWLSPGKLLVSRDYEGKKSLPEWGVNLSRENMPILEEFSFSRSVGALLAQQGAA